MKSDVWVTTVCALVVAFTAMQRYDTPETNRLSTTHRLFLASGAGYVAASLLLYALLTEIVLKPGVLQLLGFEEVTKLLAQYTAPAVLAAVVLTTLLPQAPVLKTADAFLLKRFQTLGRIPSGVSHLADGLTLSKLAVTGSDLEASRAWIRQDGGMSDDLAARLAVAPPTTTRGLFTAPTTLHRGIEALEADLAYRRHFAKHAEGWRKLRSGFRVFAAQSQAFFVLFDQLEAKAGDDVSSAALKQSRASYLGIGEEVRGVAAEFLARALLAVEPSDAHIAQRLHRLGFEGDMPRPGPPLDVLVFLCAMLVVALLVAVYLVPPTHQTLPGPLIALLIGITQCCALVLAVLPKAHWPTFRRLPDGAPPYLGWLLAAGLAGAVAFMIERDVIALYHRGLHAAFATERFPLSPIAFMAAGLALVINILCDVDLGMRRFRRLTEGVLAGAAMTLCVGLCIGLLKLPSSTRQAAPHRWFPFALSFTLGFVSGTITPHLTRVARQAKPGTAP